MSGLHLMFESYFYEQEGFHMRAERFYDDVGSKTRMRVWLQSSFNAGAYAVYKDIVELLELDPGQKATLDIIKSKYEWSDSDR